MLSYELILTLFGLLAIIVAVSKSLKAERLEMENDILKAENSVLRTENHDLKVDYKVLNLKILASSEDSMIVNKTLYEEVTESATA